MQVIGPRSMLPKSLVGTCLAGRWELYLPRAPRALRNRMIYQSSWGLSQEIGKCDLTLADGDELS